MLLSKNKKVGVFFAPKTGSVSLHKMFTSPDLDESAHNHKPYSVLQKAQIKDLDQYQFMCFYRNPIDRFISAANYQLRVASAIPFILQFFYGATTTRISSTHAIAYGALSEENQTRLNSIKLIDMLKLAKRSIWAPYMSQKTWVDAPNTTLLNFHDFDNEIIKVAGLLGVPCPVAIKENVSEGLHTIDELSPDDIAAIRSLYQADYEFFASKGIQFPQT
jgi:hypothetical protein